MKYKILNTNLKGGDVPKINISTSNMDLKQTMNAIGPLYFNLDKNPIKGPSNSYYEYDYTYSQEVTKFLIDNNLNLTPDGELGIIDKRKKTYENRIIIVNGQEIPYYLGKSHINIKFFGRIKFLFQYVLIENSLTDSTKKIITPIKKEDDIIEFIDGLFNISDEFQELISINQRLENPIDKYIFINRFYELLEIITWEASLINYNTISDYKKTEFVFTQIPLENTTNVKKLETLVKSNDFKGLIDYYMNSKNGFQVKIF